MSSCRLPQTVCWRLSGSTLSNQSKSMPKPTADWVPLFMGGACLKITVKNEIISWYPNRFIIFSKFGEKPCSCIGIHIQLPFSFSEIEDLTLRKLEYYQQSFVNHNLLIHSFKQLKCLYIETRRSTTCGSNRTCIKFRVIMEVILHNLYRITYKL